MLIEHKFKFEKNGLTIVQQVGLGSSDPHAITGHIVEQNSLCATYQESVAANAAQESVAANATGPKGGGNGLGKDPGGGGPFVSPGTTPVTFIGPFVMCCPSEDSKKEDKR